MTNHLKQSNILLCGSARVGKSTLINAICQQKLAKSTASLNSVTKSVTTYSYECSNGQSTHKTIIWDTPGIESWNENDVRSYLASLIEQAQPLCMIYCASPGSFAILDHIQWLLHECSRKNIFCALVCTNMWTGRYRQEVVNEFCRLLSLVHPNIHPTTEGNIIYYDKVALVTMVNSQEYVDEDFSVKKPPSGVEELIFGIGQCLNRDLMFAWFRSVSQNFSFWSTMSSKLSNLLNVPTEAFYSLYENTEEFLFHDAEIIDVPEQKHNKKLVFTLKSQGELSQILSRLGAKNSKTEHSKTEHEQRFSIIAEFENVEHMEAIHNIWQLAMTSQVSCTMVDEQCTNSNI
ncbi:unnamed protein product [Rotaria sp. Silwood1]|nr:unnamed protein product [Rotaria sp. Silwood1]CAF4979528.1 unnamed protein product [Rotaria sp. Silwood1]